MNSVVLARYSEDLEWITEIPEDFKVIVYNKGEKIESEAVLKRAEIIERPNEGRESETYFHHMLTSVEDNQGFTVYSQGDPFSHSPDFINLLSGWREWEPVQALSWQWLEERNIPPAGLLKEYERHLGDKLKVRPEYYSLTTWNPIGFHDPGAYGMGIVYRTLHGGLPDATNIAAHFFRLCGLEELAQNAERNSAGVFSYGAIFAARNDLVAAFPKDGFAKMQERSKGYTCYGYILERLWLHMFGVDFALPKVQALKLAA